MTQLSRGMFLVSYVRNMGKERDRRLKDHKRHDMARKSTHGIGPYSHSQLVGVLML